MEEKKNEGKVVSMQAVENQNNQSDKLTYEQLNQACVELSQQNQQMQQYIQKLRQQVQELGGMLQTKRIDYLLKVATLHAEHQLFDEKFVGDSIAEIQMSLTIPEEEERPDCKEEGKEE